MLRICSGVRVTAAVGIRVRRSGGTVEPGGRCAGAAPVGLPCRRRRRAPSRDVSPPAGPKLLAVAAFGELAGQARLPDALRQAVGGQRDRRGPQRHVLDRDRRRTRPASACGRTRRSRTRRWRCAVPECGGPCVSSSEPGTISPGCTTSSDGISATAVTPPYGERRSTTSMSCRAASRATTNRPSRQLFAGSNSGGDGQPRLASRIASGCMPRPRSSISIAKPLGTIWPDSETCVSGRREQRRVLEQLGEQVDDVADGPAGERDLGQADDDDPGVLLDLGRRRAQHVDDRHRVAPAAAGRGAGEDDQVLGVPAHAGGEVVDPEQLLQLVRVVGAPLHPVEQGQLPVQQRLAAPGDVEEDLVEAVAEVGLVHGGRDRGALHPGERVAELADLVVAVSQRWCLRVDVDRLAVAQPFDDRREPVERQRQRVLPQRRDPPDRRARAMVSEK